MKFFHEIYFRMYFGSIEFLLSLWTNFTAVTLDFGVSIGKGIPTVVGYPLEVPWSPEFLYWTFVPRHDSLSLDSFLTRYLETRQPTCWIEKTRT